MSKYRIVATRVGVWQIQIRIFWGIWNTWFTEYHNKQKAREMLDYVIEEINRRKSQKQRDKEFIKDNPPEYYP